MNTPEMNSNEQAQNAEKLNIGAIEFHIGSQGANTRIDYKIINEEDGKSLKRSRILAGRLSKDDVELISNHIAEFGFDVQSSGLPDLRDEMPQSWNVDGDFEHVIERISFTDKADSIRGLPTADNFTAGLTYSGD